MKDVASPSDMPISRNDAPFWSTSLMSVDMSAPVCWETVWNIPSTSPVWLESTPNAVMERDTSSIEVVTSAPVLAENFRNSVERLSSASPVTLNLDETVPTASPTVSQSCGTCCPTLRTLSAMASAASPSAPDLAIAASCPSSTSLRAVTAAVPAAAAAAVTTVPADFMPLPTFSALSDASPSLVASLLAAVVALSASVLALASCSLAFFKAASCWTIERWTFS